MSLQTPETVGKLQTALQAKAKAEPDYRFYLLYDKVYRKDVLWFAYRCCHSNDGKAGVDGQTFEGIEEYGVEKWLGELAAELKENRYQSQAVKRAWIPKKTGGLRPLGIPTIRDRVVQRALLLVIEPIFEVDLEPEQFAYRPERSAHEAVKAVQGHMRAGRTEVVDADLSGYFDSIPHHELMKSVSRRISDGRVLGLLKSWLVAAVEEDDGKGHRRRTTRAKDEGRGTPQGSPISPLLSNLYMRRFVLGWKKLGHEKRLGAYIVNYADDFVICTAKNAEGCLAAVREVMSKLRLTVNETKTRVCDAKREEFQFLGYRFGPTYSHRWKKKYVILSPSKNSVRSLCREVNRRTGAKTTGQSEEEIVKGLNSQLRGWQNYFNLGSVTKAYRAGMNHVRKRLRGWLKRKRGEQAGQSLYVLKDYWHGEKGLVDMNALPSGSL
jgi:RNA-directed DNA polymerase